MLGPRSLGELEFVDTALVGVVERALELSEVDFAVHDGSRELYQQQALVDLGASRTLESLHLIQESGYARAVDLVPYIAGRLRWEWEPLYAVCWAMKKAAAEHRVRIRWGGAWQEISRIGSPREAHEAYVARTKALGRTPFADGPHYELM